MPGLFHPIAGLADEPPPPAATTGRRPFAERCGGLPLTIGVIAGRIAGSDDPAAQLTHLTSEPAAEPRPHERGGSDDMTNTPIPAALDISYGGLSAAAARVYRLMGLHATLDFSAEAAAAALGIDAAAVEVLLDELTKARLLSRSGEQRWEMYGEVRPHALALAERDELAHEWTAAIARMLDFYRDTALSARADAAPYLADRAPALARIFLDRRAALQWLETEHRPLVAMARWAHEHGLHEHAWLIIHGMWPLYLHTRPSDWLDTDKHGLAAARATGDPAAEAEMLDRVGAAYLHERDYDAALAHFTQAGALWERLNNPHKIAGSLRHRADVAARQGRYEVAIDQFRSAIDQHLDLGDRRKAALGLIGLGDALTRAERPDEALVPLNEALDLFEALADTPQNDPYNAARAVVAVAMAQAARGKGGLHVARHLLVPARDEMRTIASRHGEALVCDALAELARRSGNDDEARAFTAQAEGLRTGRA